jgi:hypothetical protein
MAFLGIDRHPTEREEVASAAAVERAGISGFEAPPAVTPADDNNEVTEDIALDRPVGRSKLAVAVIVGCSILGEV